MSRFVPHYAVSLSRVSALSRTSVLLLGIVILGCLSRASADTIVVGAISFDTGVPGTAGSPGTELFTIQNFTGLNAQAGTPDSAISFLNSSFLLNGTQTVNVGSVDPGSLQPAALQFPDTTVFTGASFTASLSTLTFTLNGQTYAATSNLITADLTPAIPPDLTPDVDFVTITVDASVVTSTATPEPGAAWLVLAPLAGLFYLRARRRV